MIKVLFEDNHLLVVEKPVNMPVQADSSGDVDLLTNLKAYVKERYNKPGSVYLGLCHRLDRPVGGVMVFARTSKSAARLSSQLASHSAKKEYLCITRGSLGKEQLLTDWLCKDETNNMVSVVSKDTVGAKEAQLIAKPVATYGSLTLHHITLLTGRSHQIRVQLKHAGCPIWGDSRYGGGLPGEQIALWAAFLTINHPTHKEDMRFASKPPFLGPWINFADQIQELYQ